jgi:hypothetical protein
VRFSTRGVQKHQKKLFGGSPCQKLLAEKVEKKTFFLSAVSLHEEPKNTTKIFSKIYYNLKSGLKTSKNLKKGR